MAKSTSWLCTVCGYVHEGDAPPEFCPVCGATRDLFVPHTAVAVPRPAARSTHWRCLNCDYVHAGSTPPEVCPVCGAGADKFETLPPLEDREAIHDAPRRIVIIGAGVSGISAAEAAREASPEAEITVLSRDAHLPYYRLNLTRFLAGEIDGEALPIHPRAWYADNRITLRLDAEIRAIEPGARRILLRDGTSVAYERLILALGAHPFVPPIPGVNRENVLTLRTRADAERLLAQVGPGTGCVVIGGGVLGLEAAAALARRGAKVTLAEGFGWLLPRQLNRTAAERLAAHVRQLGITLVTDARIKQLDGDEQVRGVVLEGREAIPADLVLITAGVRSNTYLARLAGLEVGSGIVVDNHLRTSHPDIFAVGDACEHLGVSYGTWAPAQFQGTIAGMNAAGGTVTFAGIPRSNLLKVLAVEMFSIGNVHPDDGSFTTYELDEADRYAWFVFRDSRLVGAVLLGETGLSAHLKSLIETERSCAELLSRSGSAAELFANLQAGG